jgi:hypothetical protein
VAGRAPIQIVEAQSTKSDFRGLRQREVRDVDAKQESRLLERTDLSRLFPGSLPRRHIRTLARSPHRCATLLFGQ